MQPERGTFHCFGCGKGGDIFTFVMEMEGVSFREALTTLAERAGVKLSSFDRSATRAQKDARTVLEAANDLFKSALSGAGGSAARAYLARRGIGPKEAEMFELGWAPASWDHLSRSLAKNGFSASSMIEAGLVSEGERGTYDRFRGRVMFPVRDETGRLAGFGGRSIDGEGAKYVNSPEGAHFNKRKILYLLHAAKRSARERGRIILTEGYMDAIRCHLSGFSEAVASLGTSLTEDQAALIRRYVNLCFVAYDGDSAGIRASIRGMYILQKAGVDVRVLAMPDGRDPDEVLSSKGGAEIFGSCIERAMPLPVYHARALAEDLRTPGRQQAAREEILTGLASLPIFDVSQHEAEIAAALGVLQHELSRELEARRRAARSAISHQTEDAREEADRPRPRNRELDLECAAASMLWASEDLRSSYEPAEILPHLEDETACMIIAALLSGETPEEMESRWGAIGDRLCPACLARGDAVVRSGDLRDEHMPKVVETLRKNSLKRKCERLKQRVASLDATDDEMRQYAALVKELKGGGR